MSEYKSPQERVQEMSDEELLEEWDRLGEEEPHRPDRRGAWISATNTVGEELHRRGILLPAPVDFLTNTGFYDLVRGLDRGKRRERLGTIREAIEEYGAAMYRRGLRVGKGETVLKEEQIAETEP